MKAANPSFGVPDIGRELGAMWKAASEEEKASFGEQAAADKAAFLEAGGSMARKPKEPKAEKKEKGAKKEKKAKGEEGESKVKRPLSAYM